MAKTAVARYGSKNLHCAGLLRVGVAMLGSCMWRIMLVLVVLGPAVPCAWGQVIFDAPGMSPAKKAPGPPPPRAPPTIWPRLDPGSVLCRTRDDLERHAANMVARVSGGGTLPADCQIIPQPIGIQILSRQGPGATEVKRNGPNDATGWTDVWLPDKAPTRR
jgi:hypothetical protein